MSHAHKIIDTDVSFMIDPVSRAITTTSDKTILMQYDHNSERYTFQIPRFIEGHDVSLSDRVDIHYNNLSSNAADVNQNVYNVDDLIVEGDNVYFTWLVSRNATMYAGSLNFIVSISCFDEDGNIVYNWHTDIYKNIRVSAGYDYSETTVEEYSDILQQWYYRLFGTGTSAVSDIETAKTGAISDIETAKTEAISDIENEVGQTIASIPEDYSDLNNLINTVTDVQITETLLGQTTTIKKTSESISSLNTGQATRIANLGAISKIKMRYVVSADCTLTCTIRGDDFTTVYAESTADVLTGAGYAEFVFDDIAVDDANIYISVDAGERVLGSGMVTGTNVSTVYMTASNGTENSNKYRVNPASVWADCSDTAYPYAGTLEMYVYHNEEVVSLIVPESMEKRIATLESKTETNNNRPEAIRFMRFDNGKYNYYVHAEGRYLYTGGFGGYVSKIDVSCESAPEIVVSKYIASKLTCTGIAISGDYIYFCFRDPVAGLNSSTDGRNSGELIVCNKNDLSVVTDIVLDWKASRVIVYGNLMMVSCQMKGWNLYTLDDPANPALAYTYRADDVEYQGGTFYEANDKIYYIGAGFGYGIYVWDVTTPTAPTLAGKMAFAWYDSIKNIGHTFDCMVDGSYLYCTFAAMHDYWGTDNDVRGLMVVDLSNLTEWTYENAASIKWKIVQIDDADKSSTWVGTDEMPTRMTRVGNTIITNHDSGNVAVFTVSEPGTVTYSCVASVTGTGFVLPVCSTEDGRIFTGGSDGTTVGGLLHILRLTNIKFL